MCKLKDCGVVVSGLCRIKDFCVVGGFDSQYLPDTVAVDCIGPVEDSSPYVSIGMKVAL